MLRKVLVIVNGVEGRRIVDGKRWMSVLAMKAFLISVDPVIYGISTDLLSMHYQG